MNSPQAIKAEQQIESIVSSLGAMGITGTKRFRGIVDEAINSVCAEKDAEIERLKSESELHRATAVLLNESISVVSEERDTLKSQLVELREIAEWNQAMLRDLRPSYVGLCGELMLARIDAELNRYTSFIERNK